MAGRVPRSVHRVAFVLLALLAAGGAIPVAALAQGATTSPFTPGLPQSAPAVTTTTATPTVSTTNTNGSDSGLNGTGAIAIAIGALVGPRRHLVLHLARRSQARSGPRGRSAGRRGRAAGVEGEAQAAEAEPG